MKTADVIQKFINKDMSYPMGTSSLRLWKQLDLDNETALLLVGYEWAVYAERNENSFIIYNGWYGYSVTTSKQLNMIKRAIPNAIISDERKELR